MSNLAEARAKARQADKDLKDHKRHCLACTRRNPCEAAQELACDLGEMRRDVRTWFDPGADQEALWTT